MSRPTCGIVVQIRISPMDAMGIADVVEELGVYQSQMNFSAAVSVAVRSMLATMRDSELIPIRDGFEYSQVMSKFDAVKTTARTIPVLGKVKRQKGKGRWSNSPIGSGSAVSSIMSAAEQAGLAQNRIDEAKDPSTHSNPEVRRLYNQLVEMDAKKQIDPLNFDASLYNTIEQELGKLL